MCFEAVSQGPIVRSHTVDGPVNIRDGTPKVGVFPFGFPYGPQNCLLPSLSKITADVHFSDVGKGAD